MSDSTDLLEAAAALLERPDVKWIQGTLSTNEQGHIVRPTDTDATCFCVLGALSRSVHHLDETSVVDMGTWGDALAAVRGTVGQPIPEWNDAPDRTEAEVITALRLAKTKVPA